MGNSKCIAAEGIFPNGISTKSKSRTDRGCDMIWVLGLISGVQLSKLSFMKVCMRIRWEKEVKNPQILAIDGLIFR